MVDSPYSGLQWSGALSGTNPTFDMNAEIPADWFSAGAGRGVRINTNAPASGSSSTGLYNSFRVTRIIIEDVNLDRIPITQVTGLTLTAPAINATPAAVAGVTGAPTGASVTGIAWKNGGTAHTGAFGRDTAYTAVITLRANGANTFNGFTAGAANINLAVAGTDPAVTTTAEVSGSGRYLTVTATFPKTDVGTPIAASALSITKPVINVAPVTTAPTGTGFTSSAITWTPTVASNFLGDTAYTATVTLTVSGDYTFSGLTGDFTVTDATVTKEVSADNRTCKITAVFAKTDAPVKVATGNTITIVAPVVNVVAPTTGAATISGTDITGTTANVTWTPAIATGGKFIGGTAYTATVTLSATAITKTFTGVATTDFTAANGGTITSVTPGGTLAQSTAVVVITFPATAAAEKITAGTVTVGAPTVGSGMQQIAQPAASSNFTAGAIVWKKGTTVVTGSFDATTGYSAEFTLTANQYYTFDSVVISVSGGGTVSYTPATATGATVTVKVDW